MVERVERAGGGEGRGREVRGWRGEWEEGRRRGEGVRGKRKGGEEEKEVRQSKT